MDTKGFKKYYTICITSVIWHNPTAQASWDRQRKEKLTLVSPLLFYFFFSLAWFLIFKFLTGKAAWSFIYVWVCFRWKMYTKHRHTIQGSHPFLLLTEGTHCQAPFPSASQLLPCSPALDNVVTHLLAHTGKPSFFFCIDPNKSYILLSLPPFTVWDVLCTFILNYFLFPIIIPLFLDHLTIAFCSLLFCFLVPFSFHSFKLFLYFCIPAPGILIFISFLKSALLKRLFFFLCKIPNSVGDTSRGLMTQQALRRLIILVFWVLGCLSNNI